MSDLNNAQQVEETLSESSGGSNEQSSEGIIGTEAQEASQAVQDTPEVQQAKEKISNDLDESEARNAFFNQTSEEDIDKVISQMRSGTYKDNKDKNQSNRKEVSEHGLRQEEMQRRNEGQVSEDDSEEQGGSDEQGGSQEQGGSEQPKRKHKIKAQGKEYDFTLDDLKQLASKGIDYTNKMKRISPYRRMISAIEDEGITEDEINQFIEMRKGNKQAIGAFTKKHKISTIDIEEGERDSDRYQPNRYGRQPTPLNEVDNDLATSMQQKHYDKMVDFVNRGLEPESQQFFIDNPEALRLLAKDIESGTFDTVMDEIEKADYLDYYKPGVTTMQKYIDISQRKLREQAQYKQNGNNINNKTETTQNSSNKNVDKTKLGVTGAQNTSKPKQQKVVSMIEDIDDEAFNAFYKKATGFEPNY